MDKEADYLTKTLDFLISISLQPNIINLRNFQLVILSDKNSTLKYHNISQCRCKDTRIGKFEFVTKNNFFFGKFPIFFLLPINPQVTFRE